MVDAVDVADGGHASRIRLTFPAARLPNLEAQVRMPLARGPEVEAGDGRFYTHMD